MRTEPSRDIRRISRRGLLGGTVAVLATGGAGTAWALDRFAHVETLGFDYGQRHRVELDVRDAFRAAVPSARLGPDHLLRLDALGAVPVENDQTMQQMVFAHGAGTMAVVGREDDRAVAQIVL